MADATNKDNKFEKLTPIVEYTYVVVYNLLNTMRSLKNYVQAYSRDMGLQELEQYQSAIKAIEEAINGLTSSAKDLGAIYGLPEDVLHPEKMLKGLGEQIQHMQERGELPDMTKLADKLANVNNQGGSQSAPAAVPPTPPEPKPAPQAPVPPTPPEQPQPESTKPEISGMQNTPASAVSTGGSANATPASNASASTNQDQSQPSQQPASASNQQPTNDSPANNNASASGNDDDEIKKILDQLKALRNNQ